MSDEVTVDEFRDPFWSVVRRRHPDLDVVIVPEMAATDDSGLPEADADAFAHAHDAAVEGLWAALIGRGAPQRTARWIPGPTRDSVRRTVTLALDGVDAADALRRLSDAPALLEGEHWHVFTPPTGMPRVTADRSGDLGDEHLLIGCAIEQARLFLRLTSTGIPVGRAGVHALLGAAA